MDQSALQNKRGLVLPLKKSIIIFGGSGLLAVNWAIRMREDYDVILVLHKRDIKIQGVKSVFLDLSSEDDVIEFVRSHAPSLMINAIALTNLEACEEQKSLAYQANVNVASFLAYVAQLIGSKFVHISTDQLFDGTAAFVKECEAVSPKNYYARSKAEAEEKVGLINDTCLIIRTNFFGWGPIYRRSFSDWIIDSLRSDFKITLFKDVFFTPIYVSYLIDIVHELCRLEKAGLYHVVGNDRLSKFEFGLAIAHKMKLRSEQINKGCLVDMNTLVNRPGEMSLSNEKMLNDLKIRLPNIDQMIFEMLDHEYISHELVEIETSEQMS